MISARHIRAAREALGWSQSQLAKRAGIGQPTVSALERGETEAPSITTIQAIETAFTREGLILKPNGIEWHSGATYEISGDGWWLKVLDDVYDTVMDTPALPVIFYGVDDRKSNSEVVGRLKKLRNAGTVFRQFTKYGNTYLMGPTSEYRWIAEDKFINNVTIIYGNKIAACAADNTKAVVVKDQSFSDSWRNVLDILWEHLPQPDGSSADVRF